MYPTMLIRNNWELNCISKILRMQRKTKEMHTPKTSSAIE